MIIKFTEGIDINVDEEKLHSWAQLGEVIILNVKGAMGIKKIEIDIKNKTIK